jgi:Flp pilus assembly protein protease CpaA
MDGHTLTVVATHWAPAGLAGVAAAHDLRTREIPDWAPVAILAVVAAGVALGWTGATWASVLGGAALGLLAGLAVVSLAGFGGGDAKLMLALGAATGAANILPMLAFAGIMGGGLAVLALARGTRAFAYGPALAGGFVVERIAGHWEGGLVGSIGRMLGHAA